MFAISFSQANRAALYPASKESLGVIYLPVQQPERNSDKKESVCMIFTRKNYRFQWKCMEEARAALDLVMWQMIA